VSGPGLESWQVHTNSICVVKYSMLHTFMTSCLRKLGRVCLAVISLTAFSHRLFKYKTIVTWNILRENIRQRSIFSVDVRILSQSSSPLSFIDIFAWSQQLTFLTHPVRVRCYQQGCSPKKKWGTPETRLKQRFLNNLDLLTRTLIHVRKIATADLWSCPAIQLLMFECL